MSMAAKDPAKSPNLRVVPSSRSNRKPAPVADQTVDAAAASGDHLALLVSMRDRIAKAVSNPDCPPRDLASLTRRLQDIAKDIAEIRERRIQESGDGGGDDENWDPETI